VKEIRITEFAIVTDIGCTPISRLQALVAVLGIIKLVHADVVPLLYDMPSLE